MTYITQPQLITTMTTILAICSATLATAAPGQLLQTACNESDAVVLGTVEPVLLTAAPAVFTLAIDDVIKGPLAEKSNVTVSWPGSLTAARMSPSHYRALWFLRSKTSIGWEIMPIGGPNAPLFASGLAAAPLSKGIAGSSGPRCYHAVWAVLKESAPLAGDSLVYFTAMETLLREDPASGAAPPDFAVAVADFARSPSVDVKTLALASGLRRQEAQSLMQLAGDALLLSKSRGAPEASMSLAAWRGSDPAGLAALGRIAQEPGAGTLSWGASQALMMTHTKDAVPHLARLLSVPNKLMQEAAVRGLSLFVRGAPILTGPNVRAMAYLVDEQNPEYVDDKISPYITITPVPSGREDEYVKAWLDWWSRMAPKWPQ